MRTRNTLMLTFVVGCFVPMAQGYSLEDYTQEVRQKNPAYKSSVLRVEAAELDERRSEVPSAITVFSKNSYFSDTRPSLIPALQGDKFTQWSTSLGLKQRNPLGFDWSLSQSVQSSKMYNLSGNSSQPSSYYDSFPKLELSVPLWRNALGDELKAQTDALRQQTRLMRLQAMIEKEQQEIQIEVTYYKYVVQQNLLELSQKNLDRSERLYSSVRSRRARNLVDDSDEAQAKAAVSLRKLDLDRLEREARLAFGEFNGLRGDLNLPAPNLKVLQLDPLKSEEFLALATQKRESMLQQLNTLQIEASKSQSRAEYEGAKPEISFVAGLSLQGRGDSLNSSLKDMRRDRDNMWMVGINFETAFDISLSRDLLRAARLKEEAANQRLSRTLIDQNLTLQKTKEELIRCSETLSLMRELEDAQRRRFASEESKYRNGRSTLFVVLSAEQDFINAQSQRWGNELQCRVVKSQIRLFNEGLKI